MNCDQARPEHGHGESNDDSPRPCHPNMLIELVYGELDAAAETLLRQHLDACPACRAELEQLTRARAALVRWRGAEPSSTGVSPVSITAVSPVGVAGVSPASAQGPDGSATHGQDARRGGRDARATLGRRLRPRWLLPGLAAAAAVLLAAMLWLMHEKTTPTALAQGIEIKRTGLSVTILSEPPRELSPYPYGGQQQASQGGSSAQQKRVRRADQYEGQSPPDWQAAPNPSGWSMGQWMGLALVRDQRVVRNLPPGRSEVRLTDVPAGIRPDSVRLRSLDDPGGLAILEQNYQYDLASPQALLRKYVDRPLDVAFKDGGRDAGELLAFDGASLVLRPPGQGPRTLARSQVAAVRMPELPEGILSKPTLVWLLENKAARQQQFEVAYMTGGMTWRADYVLKLQGSTGVSPVGATTTGETPVIPAGLPQIIDGASLIGYATVTNRSGAAFPEAQLKLMAGDVKVVQEERENQVDVSGPGGQHGGKLGDLYAFQEKSFFEYHLYTLGRLTTLVSNETKQIELVSGSGLRLTRNYVYDPRQNATALRVVSEMKNSKANGLGKPLPKGVIRLYAPGPDGISTYVAQTQIDHTPRDEKLRLPWGHAFDVGCSARQVNTQHSGDEHMEMWQYEIRNHKDYDIPVTIIVRLPATTYKASAQPNARWYVREVGLVEIDLAVPAGQTRSVDFTYQYNNATGGNLKSPHGPRPE